MRIITLFSGILILMVSLASGQCPTAGFSVTDSVCGKTDFTITNTSTTGLNYFWDFCPGDLEVAPTGSPMTQSILNSPQQMKLVTQNGNFFLFVTNCFGNSLVRYDFGNSLDSTPVEYNYGNIGNLFNLPFGVDVIEENGNWYALVVSYSLTTVVRIDFGTDISANSASGVDLGTAGLASPFCIKIANDNGNYYAFVSNNTSNNITKIDFGNSITNTPVSVTQITNPDYAGNWGLDVIFDCSLNKFILYCASFDRNWINIIDFGSSLSGTGTVVSPLTVIGQPAAIKIVRDGINWYLFVSSLLTNEIQNFRLSGNTLNTSSLTQSFSNLGLTSPRGITSYRDSSDTKLFISINNNSGVTKAVFQKPCSASPPMSTDPTSVTAQIASSGIYHTITLEVTGPNGETAVFADSVYLNPTPLAGFVSATACDGQPVAFTDTSVIDTSSFVVTWQWDFGDNSPLSMLQNPIHTYPGVNTYAVTLTTHYDTGCEDSVTHNISVYELPDADFSFTNNQCTGTIINFTDLSQAFSGATITGWQWDFDDGTQFDLNQNPVHVFDSAGTYQIKLLVTASTGCADTLTQFITIIPSPVAGFTVSNTCIGGITAFTNTTSIQGGGTINYHWDFGDTDTSIIQDPTHPYASVSANYDVTLISIATNGCTDTLVQNIHISSRPVAQFTWTPAVVCEGNQVFFTSTSTATGTDTIAAYLWDFGDSGTSVDENPVYSYADTGYYNVTLTVISPTYCDSSVTHQVYVISSPTATFTATNVCLGVPTNFFPSVTTPPNTTVDSIVWSFGDSTFYTGLNSPVTTYTSPGTYTVTMTVYNDLLCTGTFVNSVIVYPLPVAAFTTNIVCSDSLTLFDGTASSVTGDSLTNWLWDFASQGTLSGDTAFFAFPDSGNFDITLIVSTQHGCQDTVVQNISVVQSPEFDFIFNEPCLGSASTFMYLPNDTTLLSILSWNFGDSTSSPLGNPVHTYNSVDTFMVSLHVVHNATGCASTVQHPLVVKPYPVPGYSLTENCQGLPLQFTDTSTIETGIVAGWNWNFGPLGTSNVPAPTVTSQIPGTYAVSLTVTSGEGCAATVQDSFTVFANPIVSFTPDPLFGPPPLTVNFINNTTGAVLYSWDFGDGFTGNGFNPSHIYQDTGAYTITLIAWSAEGCVDSSKTTLPVIIPYLDLAVNKVYATENNDHLKLTADLINLGNIPIVIFQISGIIEKGSEIIEEWNGYLPPGAAMVYDFTAQYDMSNRTIPGYYCIETILPNNEQDDNPANDSKCAVLSSTFEIYGCYPNPFNEQVTIAFNLPLEDEFRMMAYDDAGKLVYDSGILQGSAGYNRLEIATTNFSKAIYAFTLLFRDEIKVIKAMNY